MTDPDARLNVDLRKVPLKERTPRTGQSRPPMDLPFERLNDNERAVLRSLNGDGKGARPAKRLKEIREVFLEGAGYAVFVPRLAIQDASLRTRNGLRRLVPSGWVDKLAPGSYAISERGRKRLRRAGEQP